MSVEPFRCTLSQSPSLHPLELRQNVLGDVLLAGKSSLLKLQPSIRVKHKTV